MLWPSATPWPLIAAWVSSPMSLNCGPSADRSARPGACPQRSGFLSAFFGLVPLHGLHVFAGSVWRVLMRIEIARSGLSDSVRSRLARLALFWHFLDLIWVGILSVVYLGGRA
jgi:cytochrome o ubiquinol oxidase subunit 3